MTSASVPLPSGWATAKVDDLAEYINGLAFKPSDWESTGRKIIRIQNLTDPRKPFNRTTQDFDERFLVEPGTILVSWSATLDAFVWRGEQAVLNQHIFKVVPRRCIPDTRFVFWALKEAIAELWRSPHAHGSTMRHVNRKPFLAHPVHLPPVAEQTRIVEAIESYFTRLDDAATTLERVERNLRRYRASVLKAAVEGRLVSTEAELARQEDRDYEPASVLLERILAERRRRWEEAELAKLEAKGKPPTNDKWKAKYKEPAAPDTSELPDLPEGWCWACLDQLADIGTGSTPLRGTAEYWERGDVPWIASRAVNQDYVDEPSELVTERALDDTSLKLYPPGTLLLAMYGEGKTRGKCTELRIEATINQALAAVQLSSSPGVSRAYVKLFLEQNYVRLRRGAAGGVQPNLNLSRVRHIEVPLPPKVEQERISQEVDRLASVARAAGLTVERQAQRASRLRQAILKWAFEGKLVDQDPDDEPASVLLERIRAEHKAAASAKPSKKSRKKKVKA